MRMASLPATMDIKAALDQLKAAQPVPPTPVQTKSAPETPAGARRTPKAQPEPSTPQPDSRSEPTASKPPPNPVPEPAPSHAEEQLPLEAVSAPEPSHPVSTPPLAGPDQASLFGSAGGTVNVLGTPALRPPPEERGAQSAVAAETADVATLPRPMGQIPEGWETVVESVMESKIHVGALLHHAQAELRNGTGLTLVVPDDFHARVLREATKDILEGLSGAGHPNVSRIEFEVDGQNPPGGGPSVLGG